MKPCGVCGRVGCRVVAHSFASNAASNKSPGATNALVIATNDATNTPKNATNADSGDVVEVPTVGEAEVVGDSVGAARMGRTANRRDREDFNAYQREYMKVYRAVKAGRAEWVR